MNLVSLFTMIDELFKLEQEDLIELRDFLEEIITENGEQTTKKDSQPQAEAKQIVYNQFFINLHNCPEQSSIKGGDVMVDKNEVDEEAVIPQESSTASEDENITKGGEKMADGIGISEQELEKIAKDGLITQEENEEDCVDHVDTDYEVDFCCFIQVPTNFDLPEDFNQDNVEFTFTTDKLSCCLEKKEVCCDVTWNEQTIQLTANAFVVKIVGSIEYIISLSGVEGDKGGQLDFEETEPVTLENEASACCLETVCLDNIVYLTLSEECEENPCDDVSLEDVEGKITKIEVIELDEVCPNVTRIFIKGEFDLEPAVEDEPV
ncbi:hypothetical protein MWH28_06685 [Natroniella sulfidigena]|uniref:hypothetical protein n=1 Tax=Natroniella sulfidigena TaxID=723921 RepID=UPI00200A41E5|nr:hypothetical protein [Natroniella sulfidigena]MCK8817058.1 hypothetical protein [Natroniella sulfidigena]